jgi:hypothetical protein
VAANDKQTNVQGEWYQRKNEGGYAFTPEAAPQYVGPDGRPTNAYAGTSNTQGDVYAPWAWGGYSGTINPATGEFIPGNRIADEDVARYRGMGAEKKAAIQLDQTNANQARTMQLGSLAMLREAAAGNAPSRAAIVGQMGVADAARAGTQSAVGARGQMAVRSGGAIDSRVGEADRDRGGYMTGIAGARGQDIGAATTNAQLEAQQRAADAQRQQYYEQMGWNTNNAVLGAALGRTAADQAAANANRSQSLAESRQAFENQKQITSGVVGGVQGGAQAFGQYYDAQQNAPPPQTHQSWEDQRDIARSDVRSKYIYSDDRAKVMEAERKAYLLGRAHQMEAAYTKSDGPWAYGGPVRKGEHVTDSDPWKGASGQSRVTTMGKASGAVAKRKGPSEKQEQLAGQDRAQAATYDEGLKTALAATGSAAGYVVPHVANAVGGYAAGPPAPPAPPHRVATVSDERAKVKGDDKSMASANRSMEPSAYAYKPEFKPAEQKPGEVNVGPMAQNMAADPVAKTAIVTMPDGMLAIDKDKGLKLVMGSIASLQKQVDAMKKGKK